MPAPTFPRPGRVRWGLVGWSQCKADSWGASPVLHRPGRVRWCLPGWSHGIAWRGASPAVTGPGRVSVLGTWLRPIGTGTHWWRQGGPAGGLATDTGMKSPVEPGLSALGCLSPPSLGPEGSDGGWWGGPSARRTHGVPPPPCPGPEGPDGVRWDGPMPWGASPVLHRPGRV